jgi:chromosomal replication initiator protein
MPHDRELARTWQGVLGRLELELPAHNFEPWLRPTQPLRFDGDTLLVRTPVALHVEWLNTQFGTIAQRHLALELGREIALRFVANGHDETSTENVAKPAPTTPGLNRKYTFATYLPVGANQLALEACRAILSDDEPAASPVLVWGAPGVGKTHLLHATAACATLQCRSVALLSGEDFTDRYQRAIRANDVDQFQVALREADLLVVDDLQSIAGKGGTLNQLVATTDAVLNRGGHVLLASELHPSVLNLPERLASRIYGGLVANIGPVEGEERRMFVEHLARVSRASLPAWCLDRVAAGCCGSARILQGAVHSAINLDRCGKLTLQGLDEALAGLFIREAVTSAPDPSVVIERVAEYFQLNASDVYGRSRKADARDARAVAIAALARTGRSLSQIAAMLDDRDPSTISPLVRRGKKLLDESAALRQALAG